MSLITKDTLLDGGLVLRQYKNGYRFSIDPLILSHFVTPKPSDSVMDLGTGCGIIPLVMAYRHPCLKITGCEIQQDLFFLAQKNAAKSAFKDRLTIINKDMKDLFSLYKKPTFDIVVSNPPYTKKNNGRLNPDMEKAIARHELKITLKELLQSASSILKESGHLYLIYPFARKEECIQEMPHFGLYPEILRDVYTKPEKQPELFLVRAGKNKNIPAIIQKRLCIYNKAGKGITDHTDEIKNYFSP
jgi:tRNA1Val (adenine37-N6)-methyltransferase